MHTYDYVRFVDAICRKPNRNNNKTIRLNTLRLYGVIWVASYLYLYLYLISQEFCISITHSEASLHKITQISQ